MRPRNQSARDQLATLLARHGPVAGPDLAQRLGVSVPTLHRLLAEQAPMIVSRGKARRTRHALRRALRGDAAELPLYAVDAAGRAETAGRLSLVHPQGAWLALDERIWPIPGESVDGWWSGLPYPLADMRPQGYLGRQFARAEAVRLQVPLSPEEWSDDDVAFVLSRWGSDTSGDLILGDPAFERWQSSLLASPEPIPSRTLARSYARLAELALASGVAGSSAAGEFPKFPALRELGGSATPHVLVKFSGADGSPAVQRWADLLVCEHLALECAALLPGVAVARSRVVRAQGRTFLEVERFDRHGPHGRSPLVSLATLDAALLGEGTSDWTRLASRLHDAGLLGADDLRRVQHLWCYGRLIANSDMHTGNLSFRPQRTLALAPTYDMLPMRYAPLPGGEVATRDFTPALPLPDQRPAWSAASAAAIAFWQRAAKDARISVGFRSLCAGNQVALERIAQKA